MTNHTFTSDDLRYFSDNLRRIATRDELMHGAATFRSQALEDVAGKIEKAADTGKFELEDFPTLKVHLPGCSPPKLS